MKNLYYKIGAAISTLPALFLPATAFAQLTEARTTLGASGVGAPLGPQEPDLPVLVGRFINVFLSVLGIIFVVLVVYAGFLYMTAGGNEDGVKKAKRLLAQAIIGIVIIVTAYAISTFIIDQLVTATGN